MSRSEWLERFGAVLNVEPPSDELIDGILAIAGMAAHASERTAAPISAWMVGKAGVDVLSGKRRLSAWPTERKGPREG